nr:nascent polypeptide-associated complex subunit alpha, muscle-specific form-like [Dasypus novemcinctus]
MSQALPRASRPRDAPAPKGQAPVCHVLPPGSSLRAQTPSPQWAPRFPVPVEWSSAGLRKRLAVLLLPPRSISTRRALGRTPPRGQPYSGSIPTREHLYPGSTPGAAPLREHSGSSPYWGGALPRSSPARPPAGSSGCCGACAPAGAQVLPSRRCPCADQWAARLRPHPPGLALCWRHTRPKALRGLGAVTPSPSSQVCVVARDPFWRQHRAEAGCLLQPRGRPAGAAVFSGSPGPICQALLLRSSRWGPWPAGWSSGAVPPSPALKAWPLSAWENFPGVRLSGMAPEKGHFTNPGSQFLPRFSGLRPEKVGQGETAGMGQRAHTARALREPGRETQILPAVEDRRRTHRRSPQRKKLVANPQTIE